MHVYAFQMPVYGQRDNINLKWNGPIKRCLLYLTIPKATLSSFSLQIHDTEISISLVLVSAS